jgi:hypothetical protein
MTHNRGIVNRFFTHRNPAFTADLGKRIVLTDEQQGEMLETLGYCARQLDIRAVKTFGLTTIAPTVEESSGGTSPDETRYRWIGRVARPACVTTSRDLQTTRTQQRNIAMSKHCAPAHLAT